MPKFNVNFRVSGRINMTIEATGPEDAARQAQAMVEDEEFGLELDEADIVDIGSISELHPVTRNGRNMWVTYVFPSDVPWSPDNA